MTAWFAWTPAKIDRLRELWADPSLTIDEITVQMDANTRNVIVGKARSLNLPRRGGGRRPLFRPTIGETDRSGQRRLLGKTGRLHKADLKPDNPAVIEGRTLFRNRVTDANDVDRVLKEGKNSSKIGNRVEKGRWKGMPIFTLTLEERKTCPRTCLQWRTCYGSNMQWAQRIRHDGDFAIHLSSELLRLQAKHPAGFVVRLHVLGDFYSVEYVEFWKLALETLPALHIFGYTARQPHTEIGSAIHALVRAKWARFAIRFSDSGAKLAAAEVVETEKQARGLLCPAETDPHRCCGSCGLCWHSASDAPNRPSIPLISFLRH